MVRIGDMCQARHPSAAWLLLVLLVAGCESDNSSSTSKPGFDLSGASAVALYDPDEYQALRSPHAAQEPDCNLVAIGANGQVTPACDRMVVTDFRLFRGGAWIETTDNDWRRIIVLDDGSVHKVDDRLAGQNSEDDLFFADLSIFRKDSESFDDITTTLTNPVVIAMSGDFLLVEDLESGISQIHSTTTGNRYNLNACDTEITALSSTRAFVNGCIPGEEIINLSNGSRSAAELEDHTGESLALNGDGGVFLSSGCPPQGGGVFLCHVDTTGDITPLLTSTVVAVADSGCILCRNRVLLGSEAGIVIHETSQVTFVESGVDSKAEVLSGLNVISLDLDGFTLFYSAEDTSGNPVHGTVNLHDFTEDESESSLPINDIQAVP